ncbi:hypothetical protein [Paenibacillus fonticola]|uniref:hypothetical protein n=1 Tax=Paenibacillus fonticola TaxID=379896 RepID=UPI00036E5FD9|nr:hypothetical protein [Paenibacillus fonticola]
MVIEACKEAKIEMMTGEYAVENNKLKITLEFPGIVVFDPMTLSSFIQEKKIVNTDLISYFNQYEDVGEEAITQGVIIPIYPIPNLDYTIVIKNEYDSLTSVPIDWRIFKTEPFPLKITSGLVIVSDISAIMDWDEEFFVNYEGNLENRTTLNDYTKIANGNYGVSIIGYCDPKKGLEADFGYILDFQRNEELPNFNFNKSIDEYDFIVDPLSK